MSIDKNRLLLYAITDRKNEPLDDYLKKIEAALAGGVTLLQLREKDLAGEELLIEAAKVKSLCDRYKVPLIINDNVDLALKAGAAGVHVGIEDEDVSSIRRRAPEGFIIGATAKTVEQAVKAEKAGADYLGVGAVFPSPTKKAAVRITTADLSQICGSVDIPAVAIGGISLENADMLKGGKMAGIAVISAIFSAPDVKEAAQRLYKKAKELAC